MKSSSNAALLGTQTVDLPGTSVRMAMGYPHEWWVEPGVHDFDFWNRAISADLAWWDRQRKNMKEGTP
jgi:hypothetical protein